MGLAALVALAMAAPAAASTLHVTNGGNTGNGSLRKAVEDAQPSGDVIVIDPGVSQIILNSQVAIDKSLTLVGQGAGSTEITATGTTRLLNIGKVTPGIAIKIEKLKLAGGRAPNGAPGSPEVFPSVPPGQGGAGEGGGAILSAANQLELAEVTLTGNEAGDGGTGGPVAGGSFPPGGGGLGGGGGGISNSGTLTIISSTISANEAGVGGAPGTGGSFPGFTGAAGSGGAISNSGTLTILNSTLSGNKAAPGSIGQTGPGFAQPGTPGGGGGAIFSSGTLTVVASTLAGNLAGAGGAGGSDFTFPGGAGGSGGFGGAVFAPLGVTRVTNSTLVANRAGAGGPGGGFMASAMPGGAGGGGGNGGAVANGPSSSVTVAGSTLISNGAGAGGVGGQTMTPGPAGGEGSGGGLFAIVAITVRASLLSSNTGVGPNCFGSITDAGGNLAAPEAGGCAGFPVGDPKLDPAGLASNGGPTQTIALLPGSTAIDAVPATSCLTADGTALTTDQRGVKRPQGPACDSGAYEVAVSSPPSPTVPDTKLTKKPKSKVKTRKKRARVVVAFTSTPSGATFECKLDNGRFKPCKSPKSYKVKRGRHKIAVRAVLEGVRDPTPAEAKFKVLKMKKASKAQTGKGK